MHNHDHDHDEFRDHIHEQIHDHMQDHFERRRARAAAFARSRGWGREDDMSGNEEHWGRGRPPFRGRRGRMAGWFEGEPAGSFFGRGPRAARGDIRAAILALLAETPMHGYQVIKELETRSGGVWKPSPGSVYPTLQHLEEEGVVRGRDEDGKRVFELTDAGRAELSAREPERPAPWEEVGSEVGRDLVGLRDLARDMAIAVKLIAHTGNPAQVEGARAVLSDARRALYRVLADEPTPGPASAPAPAPSPSSDPDTHGAGTVEI